MIALLYVRMYLLTINCFWILSLATVSCLYDNEINLKCQGTTYANVSLTAYYPDYSDQDHERGYFDSRKNKLRTLQDYIDDRTEFVTVAMDPKLNLTYGTPVCIPEINNHFGHRIRFEVRDVSDTLMGMGFKRAEICVRSDTDSYDLYLNRIATLIFLEE